MATAMTTAPRKAHGPVSIGGTDTLYGIMKIVAFVCQFKELAMGVLLPDWIELVAAAVETKKRESC